MYFMFYTHTVILINMKNTFLDPGNCVQRITSVTRISFGHERFKISDQQVTSLFCPEDFTLLKKGIEEKTFRQSGMMRSRGFRSPIMQSLT